MNAKEVIKKYSNLIKSEDWEEFYYQILTDTYGTNNKSATISEITELLHEAGYYPIEKLWYIPSFYFWEWDFSHFDIPSNISQIGYCAFKNCRELKQIVIPNNCANIESEAFTNCSALSEVIFEDVWVDIAPDAFLYCENLRSIIIKKSYKTVNDASFLDNSSKWLPPNVKSIKCLDREIEL